VALPLVAVGQLALRRLRRASPRIRRLYTLHRMSDVTTTRVVPASRSWRDVLGVYREPPAVRMLFLGFSAGLPLLLVLGTLAFRLREAGIDRTTIGYLSWVGLAYGVKWAWAPLVDRLPLPLLTRALGRRRSWLLLAQLVVAGGLVGLALADPRNGLQALVFFALVVAFGSATQDIALDAYRIESARTDKQAALAAMYQTGYRLAMIWAGAGVLWIAARATGDHAADLGDRYAAGAWTIAYLVMAASMAVGIVTVLLAPEPVAGDRLRGMAEEEVRIARRLVEQQGMPIAVARVLAWLQTAVAGPFLDFVRRYRWHALLLLALIAVYRISDIVMGIMANPFYVDMGYSKDEVAAVSKFYGVVMTLAGAFIGGALALRVGVIRVLMLGAVLSAASNVLFAWLATRGHDLTGLIFVISADNLSAGIASAAFIAYLSSLTNVAYSATQYALFSSVMLLAPKFIAGYSGAFVDAYGYIAFFHTTALLGVPVLILVWIAGRAIPVAARAAGPDQASPSQ
jgi:MFS transporter, PAT family, beta-lactamase induction signal transducer AmpG